MFNINNVQDYNELKYKTNNEKYFLNKYNQKFVLDYPPLIPKKIENNNKIINQFNHNVFESKKINEKKIIYDTALTSLKAKDEEENIQEDKIMKKFDDNDLNEKDLEVKYIMINNENIYLGTSKKLQNKINPIKNTKKFKKIKFKINRKEINSNNNIDSEEKQDEEKISITKQNSALSDKENEKIKNSNNNNEEILSPNNLNKNKFLLSQEEKKNIFFNNNNINSSLNSNYINFTQNNSYNNNYNMKKIDEYSDAMKKDYQNQDIGSNIRENNNFIRGNYLYNERNKNYNFPQIFESQNAELIIGGIEYTTLLIPKMCAEKIKSLIFN